METPNGEKMIAIPYTISFVTWMSESQVDRYSAHWAGVMKQVADGTADMLKENAVSMNKGWKHIYLEVGSAVLRQSVTA